jgi:hypothetical protein
MSDHSLLPTDDEIIAAAVQHQQDVREKRYANLPHIGTGFPLLQHGRPVAWVKYTDSSSCLERGTETQAYVYETLNQQPALLEFLRVPEVLRLIEIDDRPYVLVVMEYVHGDYRSTVPQERRYRGKKTSLQGPNSMRSQHLAQPPATPRHASWPAGGGRIEHLIFGEYAEPDQAPRDFDSAQDLAHFINETIVSF